MVSKKISSKYICKIQITQLRAQPFDLFSLLIVEKSQRILIGLIEALKVTISRQWFSRQFNG